jgi:hypothetical protein
MLMTARKIATGCWVDVFEQPHFQGRMRRMFGPGDFEACVAERGKPTAASMVVGPGATVMCLWRRRRPGRQDEQWLRPSGVIPDLSRLIEGGTLRSIRIVPKQV